MKQWYWAKTGGSLVAPDLKPTSDKTHHKDEDTHPDNDHIYSYDSPGLAGPLAIPPFMALVPPPSVPVSLKWFT